MAWKVKFIHKSRFNTYLSTYSHWQLSTKHDKNMHSLLDGKLNSDFCFAISELRRERGRVSTLNWSINWLHHIKGHAEIGYLTELGVLKLNGDQVMTLETLLKIHTNVCNFCDSAPPPPSLGCFLGHLRYRFLVYFSLLLLASWLFKFYC